MHIHYVEQGELLGSAHAAAVVEPHIDRPFVLMLGDIYFDGGDLLEMVRVFREEGGCAVLATDKTPAAEALRRNFAVHVAADGYVTRVVEKPRGLGRPRGVERGVGVYLFDLPLFDAIRRTPRTGPNREYEITSSVQCLIDEGHPVRSVDAVHGDVNLTSLCDLLAVNLRVVGRASRKLLIGPGCRVHDGAEIEDSIIGADVTIGNPISIRRSLVFASTLLDTSAAIENSVVAPGMSQRCDRDSLRRVIHERGPACLEAGQSVASVPSP